MDYIWHYPSPLGDITLASDGTSLIGLWFDTQRLYASTLLPPSSRATLSDHSASVSSSLTSSVPAFSAVASSSSTSVPSSPTCFNDLVQAGYPVTSLPVFGEACRWLDIYFSGRDPGFTPPLELRGSPFRLSVWKALLHIPFGHITTYGSLASSLAVPFSGFHFTSARAVGGAVGHNPISLIVPCHRVIGAAGRLTGFAAGLDRKLRLLRLEGISL